MKRCPRRRMYSWPRKTFFRVSWGGFLLTIRLYPFRGWEAVSLLRRGPPEEYLWQLPPEQVHR